VDSGQVEHPATGSDSLADLRVPVPAAGRVGEIRAANSVQSASLVPREVHLERWIAVRDASGDQLPLSRRNAQIAREDCEEFAMTSDSPARDFLQPRLTALLDEAVANGIARDVAVAVMIDVVTSPAFDTAAPDPKADSEPHPDYQRERGMVLVHGMVPLGPLPIDAQDEADFIKPFGPMTPS
jgi:hypothetical protein